MAVEQEKFWKGNFGKGYVERNSDFDYAVTEKGWRQMLRKASGVRSALECGSNIGRNLEGLRRVDPSMDLGLIEINEAAYRTAVERVKPVRSFNGPILQSSFEPASFDLAFTCGVLIHIAPDDLAANLEKVFLYSRRWIVICEYFNRTPVSLPYHGEPDKLFKRDFGKFFMERFSVNVVDYGFLWSPEFEAGGFDDMTWWLFEKKTGVS